MPSAASWLAATLRYVTNANDVPSAADALVACDLDERAAIPVREEGVTVEVAMDLGEHELVGVGERCRVDLRAADDEDVLLIGEERERLLE